MAIRLTDRRGDGAIHVATTFLLAFVWLFGLAGLPEPSGLGAIALATLAGLARARRRPPQTAAIL